MGPGSIRSMLNACGELPHRRVDLAGDHLTAPWMEATVRSGEMPPTESRPAHEESDHRPAEEDVFGSVTVSICSGALDVGKTLRTQGSLVLCAIADLKLTVTVSGTGTVEVSVMGVLNVLNVLWLAASELTKSVVAAALSRAHHYGP